MTIVTKMQRQHAKHNSKPTPMPSIGLCPPCANAGPRISAGSGDGQAKGQSGLPDFDFSFSFALVVSPPRQGQHAIGPGMSSAPRAVTRGRRPVLRASFLGLACMLPAATASGADVTASAAAAHARADRGAGLSAPCNDGRLAFPLRLRGGTAVTMQAPGGWRGAASYYAETGINITATAGSIAAYRSAVSLCNSSFLDDPFAALFAREACPERFKEILALPAPKLARFAVRTKFFDNFIRDCVHRRGIKQVVLLGAGFDARVLRGKDMRWDTLMPPTARDLMESNVVTFYELDLPELINSKSELLERAGMGPRAARSLGLPAVHRIGVDVMSDDWMALLQRYGFMKDRPTAWLLEGFLYYFDQPDVMRTLRAIADMSAPGSRIGMSAVSAAAASSDGGKWKWGSDFPEAVLEEFGWDEALAFELGCTSIAEGWDMSFVGAPEPRDKRLVKRTWYVTAAWPGLPATTERQRLQEWLKKTWLRAKPWLHLVGRHCLQFATTGFQVRLPLPPWLADAMRR